MDRRNNKVVDQTKSRAGERSKPTRSRTFIMWEDDTNTMSFDAVTETTFNRTAEITRYPVEDGFVYSDHFLANPKEVRIRARVTDQPVVAPQDHVAAGVTATSGEPPGFRQKILDNPYLKKPTISLPSGRLIRNSVEYAKGRKIHAPNVLLFEGGSPKRVVNVVSQLETFMDNGTLLTVQTKHQRFNNMAIKSLDVDRMNQLGDGVEILLELSEIRVVQDIVSISGGARRLPSKKADGGKDSAGGDTEDAKDKGSTLYWLGEAINMQKRFGISLIGESFGLPELSEVPGVQ